MDAKSAYAAARNHVLTLLPKQATGAEIGVWRGDFSASILSAAEPALLHLIDPWLHVDDKAHQGSLYGQAGQSNMDDLHEYVCQRFSAERAAGKVQIHRATSETVLPTFAPDSLDFIYIDGDHAFDAVLKDAEMSYRVVRPGGLICLDDHYSGKWWGDGVVRAVNQFLGRHADSVQLGFVGNGQVVIQRLR